MGGHVLPMISNRRQDYGMCHFILIRTFPTFLTKQTFPALRSGLKAVQAFVIQDHVLRYLRDGKTFEDLMLQFQFRGGTANYVEDNSVIWDETSYPIGNSKSQTRFLIGFQMRQKTIELRILKGFLDVQSELKSRLFVVASFGGRRYTSGNAWSASLGISKG